MNRYQKVLVCIFRTLGIILLGYTSVSLLIATVMMTGMAGMAVWACLPILGLGLVSYFAAVPFAKIITIGIEE
jgi:hypothetical protein